MPTTASRLANRIRKVSPSLTLAIEAKAKQMKQQGVDVVSLSAGEPDFDTPEFIKAKAIEALNKGLTKYTPAVGTLELRKAISEKLAKENNLSYAPEDIVVSCGAKHSIFNAIQVLIEEGDEVVIPGPFWLSYPEMVTLAGGRCVVVPTSLQSGYKMTARELEAALTPKTKIVIINSPSNPTGCVYTKEELTAFGEICAERSVLVLSDEIYEKLTFDGAKHYSIGALVPGLKDLTITVNGASKSYAMTGWRLGYAACPREIAEAVGSLQSHSTSNPTSFAQEGFVEAILDGSADAERMRVAFERRRNLMAELLGKIPKLRFLKPQGAFYLFCDISGFGLSSMEFSRRLLEEAGVAVVPGVAFGDNHAIRTSFATSEDNIKKAIQRIADWASRF